MERRKHIRRAISLPVLIAPQSETQTLSDWHFAEISEVSSGGARLKLAAVRSFKKNDLLELLCSQSNMDNFLGNEWTPYRIIGRVVWQNIKKGRIGINYE